MQCHYELFKTSAKISEWDKILLVVLWFQQELVFVIYCFKVAELFNFRQPSTQINKLGLHKTASKETIYTMWIPPGSLTLIWTRENNMKLMIAIISFTQMAQTNSWLQLKPTHCFGWKLTRTQSQINCHCYAILMHEGRQLAIRFRENAIGRLLELPVYANCPLE